LSDFTHMVDLAAQRLGGQALRCSDDFFAEMQNLLKPEPAVFIDGKYTDRGKWMDGWESRRKRVPGHDWCIIRLGLPGIVRGVNVDTSFFRGNYPPRCSIDACDVPGNPTGEELAALGSGPPWREILKQCDLKGDSKDQNLFAIADDTRVTHLRLNIYPDGGVARLRVHGEVLPDWDRLLASPVPVDLCAMENAGTVPACSDMFFGHAPNMLQPGPSLNMGDGWETKRRRGPGYDWAVVRLARPGVIERVELDTAFFKGNYPDTADIETCEASGHAVPPDGTRWRPLVARTKLQADHKHFFDIAPGDRRPCTHARLNIYPDGGVARLRLWGRFR